MAEIKRIFTSTYNTALCSYNSTFASAAYNYTIHIWDAPPRSLMGHSGWITSLTNYNHTIISTSYDKTIRLWSDVVHTYSEHTDIVECACITNNTILSGARNAVIHQTDIETKETLRIYKHEEGIASLCMMTNDIFISGSDDQILRIWDVRSSTPIHTIKTNTDMISVASICKMNSTQFVSANGSVMLWDIRTFKPIQSHNEHTDYVKVVRKLDNDMIVSGGTDNKICVYNIPMNKVLKIHSHTDWVWDILVLNPETFISASYDKTIRKWKIKRSPI